MSIQQLTSQLRALPYTDMMEVAKAISRELGALQLVQVGKPDISPTVIADVLTSLHQLNIATSLETTQEEKILHDIFSRKRTFSISRPMARGWNLQCPSLPGSTVIGTELRPMLPLMLDQIITLHLLQRK